MPCLSARSARLVFDLPAVSLWWSLRGPRSLRRAFHVAYSYSRSIATVPTRRPPRRAFSAVAHRRDNDFFEYTSGRWIFNDELRHTERRRVFNVDGLRRLAAESVDRSPDDIVSMVKLAEGGSNRAFLITMRGGFQMVARIPYPATVPKYFAVASEVATMALLRSSGLPVPAVYGYAPAPDNAAETEYIFMEFVQGTDLSDVWFDLRERDILSITRQLAELEAKMMSIAFPAGGSLYYTEDLEKVAGTPGIMLEDARFCVGPDTRVSLWYGRRSQLDIDRGPYKSAEAALVRGTEKELAYLQQFGRPLLPFQRMRREAYHYQAQPPSDHVENLHRYLRIASQLVPKDPALCQFRIRHPDLQPGNIIVSRSPAADSELRIVSLIDWQHTAILPLFLLASVPQCLQNHSDPVSHCMLPPALPANLDALSAAARSRAEEAYHRRVVHYCYVNNTEERNRPHYDAMTDRVCVLRSRLFCHAGDPWEGETIELKAALIRAAETWETLVGDDAPCPVVFDAEDVRETAKLNGVLEESDRLVEAWQNASGLGQDGLVSTQHYDEAMVLCKRMKESALADAEATEEERAQIAAHWPFDNMDEEEYM